MRWCLFFLLLGLTVADLQAQVFVPIGHMTRSRIGHSATLLQDGRVLIAGGEPTGSAEIFDPDSGTFSETGAMTSPRFVHPAVLLLDGRVFVAGGCGEPCSINAEIYDPATGTFTPTGNMSVAQDVSAAVLLRNGKVLVVGYLTAELFDPASGRFEYLGHSMLYGNSQFVITATLLSNGTVLLYGYGPWIFDPTTKQFRDLKSDWDSGLPPPTAMLGGSVLFRATSAPYNDHNSGLYDPATETFNYGPLTNMPREYATGTLLQDGRVLLAGGFHVIRGLLGSAEMYDPATGRITQLAASMRLNRDTHRATRLRDGRVLITGGRTILTNSLSISDTLAEVFVPETTQGIVPRLALDRTRYCVGDSWRLQADTVPPDTAIQISGTWDETPWTIPNWTTSGQDGTVVASGEFGPDTVGDYQVWIQARGKVSKSVFVSIRNCSGGDR